MTNRPAGLMKRILAAFIDFVCVFFVCYALTIAFTSSKLFENMFNIEEKYTAMNEVFCPSLVEKGLGYYDDDEKYVTCKQYTSEELFDMHYDEYKKNNPDKTADEISDMIFDDLQVLVDEHNTMIEKNEIYQKNYQELVNINTGIFYTAIFIGEVVFLLIIPLTNRNNKTLGKYLLKLRLVTTKDLYVRKKDILINFITIYAIETVIYSVFLGIDNLIVFMPLISLMVILFSPRRQNIHHMISKTIIVEEQTAVIFSSFEEKEKYDASLRR